MNNDKKLHNKTSMESNDENSAILIVDDEVSLRNTFRIFLEREGYSTVEAVATFEEALDTASKQVFDLIICDIVLESRSGIDLLKEFKKRGIDCPIVIITGFPHVETASEAVRLGAFDYIPKPVEKEALLKIARLAIRHYHLQQQKKAAEIEKENAKKYLETIFSSVSDAILSVDLQLNIIQINNAATQLFPFAADPSPGITNLKTTSKNNGLNSLASLTEEVLSSGCRISDHRMEYRYNNSTILLSVCISPLINTITEAGVCTGAVIVMRDITYKKALPKDQTQFHNMLGKSRAMHDIFTLIQNIGKVDTTVLITGASGTGKELAAESLHLESSRKDKPLVKVDCTAIPDNLLESELFGHKKGSFTGATENRQGRIIQADGGTLFLDEIGDISMTMQLRLLRFLQEKSFYPVGRDREVHVDVRLIAATNANLKEKVENGVFREDLYYRLLIIELALPLLRERYGDIELLANYFIEHFAHKMNKKISGISDRALACLCQYDWPGNVRQLQHTIERACVLCEETTISSKHLPADITQAESNLKSIEELSDSPYLKTEDTSQPVDFSASTQPMEIHHQSQKAAEEIIAALKKAGGNKAKAARLLKIDRSTLYRKIHELHINTDSFSF